MENLKFTKEVNKQNNQTTTNFYINDIMVVRSRVYKTYYCTIKNGAPSTIANKIKVAKETTWNREGLVKLLGDKYVRENYKNHGPDTRWGDVGYAINMVQLKEKFKI